MAKDRVFELCDIVREASFALHRYLRDEHIAQLLEYLRSCTIGHGLLINFGSPKLQIKKYADLDNPEV